MPGDRRFAAGNQASLGHHGITNWRTARGEKGNCLAVAAPTASDQHMFDAQYLFVLMDESIVKTEGRNVTARNVVGRGYTEGDYFDDEHTPTYIVEGQTGGFVVKQEDVVTIVELDQRQR